MHGDLEKLVAPHVVCCGRREGLGRLECNMPGSLSPLEISGDEMVSVGAGKYVAARDVRLLSWPL